MDSDTLNKLKEFLPFLIPFILIQFALMFTALVHVIRHPKYKIGNRIIWILIVVFIQILGPVIYFAFGKGEEE